MVNPDVAELLRYNDSDPARDQYERVLFDAACLHGLTVADLRGQDRRSPRPAARAAAAVRLRRMGLSLPAIGRLLGGRHHTTVMYYLNGKGTDHYGSVG